METVELQNIGGALPFLLSLLLQTPVPTLRSHCSWKILIDVISHLDEVIRGRTNLPPPGRNEGKLQDERAIKVEEIGEKIEHIIFKIEDTTQKAASKQFNIMKSTLIRWVISGENTQGQRRKKLSRKQRDLCLAPAGSMPNISTLCYEDQSVVLALAGAGQEPLSQEDFEVVLQHRGHLSILGTQLRRFIEPFFESHGHLKCFQRAGGSNKHTRPAAEVEERPKKRIKTSTIAQPGSVSDNVFIAQRYTTDTAIPPYMCSTPEPIVQNEQALAPTQTANVLGSRHHPFEAAYPLMCPEQPIEDLHFPTWQLNEESLNLISGPPLNMILPPWARSTPSKDCLTGRERLFNTVDAVLGTTELIQE
ncbi:hypothetical protein EK21DRAFT_113327 [Setomelanomma holmii]|uniref:Uncharacterized protein n=1 Tax=Setomelanomma holmii TaxID=210430 RepID=A0A9P4H6A9_9PLEO|nr:hypothetical protein EK21DRAFT_113327 [Setomelanomma holmii]